MEYLEAGQFRGETYQTTTFEGITATETEYDYDFIDWHYHENPYFSLNTLGTCSEINKRETIECSTDTLVFHNCHEPHCNVKSGGISRQFQLELDHNWCKKYEVDIDRLPNSAIIADPNIKLLFYNIYKESKLSDDASGLTVDSLLLQAFETIRGVQRVSDASKPSWVNRIKEILHDNFDRPLTLRELSDELDLHSAHLSRDFSKYFSCNFGEYIRKIRVEKSVAMLRKKKLSLTDIALMCGFADQSHFIRCFKEFNGITPKKFRQII